MIEKHEKRAKSHLRLTNELNNVSKQERKNTILREKAHLENVENTVIAKLEEINGRKETNYLKKIDQQHNLLELKRKHEMDMLKLQAKHFGIEAKRGLRKVSVDQTNSDYKVDNSIKYQYHSEIKNYADKIDNLNRNKGQPTGLRTLSAYRQPKLIKE
jgi:hypothetical protein